MKVRSFWSATMAAAVRLQELGIKTDRCPPPNAHLRWDTELPDGEFKILRKGNPAIETLVGLASEQ